MAVGRQHLDLFVLASFLVSTTCSYFLCLMVASRTIGCWWQLGVTIRL